MYLSYGMGKKTKNGHLKYVLYLEKLKYYINSLFVSLEENHTPLHNKQQFKEFPGLDDFLLRFFIK